ncbi:sigma-70 family RNA polymerase sigma factor [Ruania alkalisoli]|uniref:Sigma-70 family RNA polymerase sigma factor n=1 Tax=Ruania alkalisoli TaxID=2779775 RepID=A0A7M1SUH4_9MICO|nr:sigma-70 family RNA polymerase sigma factor [Ruania alkalisoli]QOR71185.1 sigma-70 family RNA polymerase sigma factor [Ruania alkalisoli]
MEGLLRELGPRTLAVLVRRGAEFTAAEDAVQEALIEAVRRWPERMPEDPPAWLVRVAWRKFLDQVRSEQARRQREVRVAVEPPTGPAEQADDTLLLLTRCCHPELSPASAVALTLRAVAGLTTAQIARAYLVPEATMAQRISRAKRTLRDARFDRVGHAAAVLRVLYLMFDHGFTGPVDVAEEAIRLTRQLANADRHPEIDGLLALMLLHHARRAARLTSTGELVPLDEQDRTRWDTAMIAEGVQILQGALTRDRLGEYQVQAAIAALHDDATRAEETDWLQVLSWYDELARLVPRNPAIVMNRAVAVAQVDGPPAGLRALAEVPDGVPRRAAVAAWLHEHAGDAHRASELYVEAADAASSEAERVHLLKRAARLR